jgi:hypothetical protein
VEAKLLSLSEKRLVRLFRRAALQHIRRELRNAKATLDEAEFLLDEGNVLLFLREWAAAVESERSGLSPPSAPAAWIHLAQELASVLESGGDWSLYLDSRWRLENGRIGWSRRLFFGLLGALAFSLSGLVTALLARHIAAGNWDGLAVGSMHTQGEKLLAFVLIFGRVAGTVLMVEHGCTWAKKALSGRVEEPRALFLGTEQGLALVEPPSI